MRLTYFIFLTLLTSCASSRGLIKRECVGTPKEVIDTLSASLKKKGIKVFGKINHQKNAKKVGLKMEQSILLVFGNPKLGTHFFTSSPSAGIDLPMKALAYLDKDGKTFLAYNDPSYIVERHLIKDRKEIVKKMKGALEKFSSIACTPK